MIQTLTIALLLLIILSIHLGILILQCYLATHATIFLSLTKRSQIALHYNSNKKSVSLYYAFSTRVPQSSTKGTGMSPATPPLAEGKNWIKKQTKTTQEAS